MKILNIANPSKDIPTPLLEVRTWDPDTSVPLLGLCAGYECGSWRCEELSRHVIDWLLDFALPPSLKNEVSHSTATEFFRRAVTTIYNTDKYQRRGEFGEILLHAVVRQCFGTIPAVAKVFYKDASNDTVKGFDCVHVVPTEEGLELWLGEVKFYSSIASAISDVVGELAKHTDTDYLRNEFALITNKIDDGWPHAADLKKLLNPNTSLDSVFKRTRIPVLLTYDSSAIQSYSEVTDEFKAQLSAEMAGHHQTFSSNSLPERLELLLILVPLKKKAELVERIQTRLEAAQKL